MKVKGIEDDGAQLTVYSLSGKAVIVVSENYGDDMACVMLGYRGLKYLHNELGELLDSGEFD